jgi:hypothetical protein
LDDLRQVQQTSNVLKLGWQIHVENMSMVFQPLEVRYINCHFDVFSETAPRRQRWACFRWKAKSGHQRGSFEAIEWPN